MDFPEFPLFFYGWKIGKPTPEVLSTHAHQWAPAQAIRVLPSYAPAHRALGALQRDRGHGSARAHSHISS